MRNILASALSKQCVSIRRTPTNVSFTRHSHNAGEGYLFCHDQCTTFDAFEAYSIKLMNFPDQQDILYLRVDDLDLPLARWPCNSGFGYGPRPVHVYVR